MTMTSSPVAMQPWDAPILALPANAADYRSAVGLGPARGGEGGFVHYVRLGRDRFRVDCAVCKSSTGLMTWKGANAAGIAHQCVHARHDHDEPLVVTIRPGGYPPDY
jgi:hypothetical protein